MHALWMTAHTCALVTALSVTLDVMSARVVTESARHTHILGGQVRRFYTKARVKP